MDDSAQVDKIECRNWLLSRSSSSGHAACWDTDILSESSNEETGETHMHNKDKEEAMEKYSRMATICWMQLWSAYWSIDPVINMSWETPQCSCWVIIRHLCARYRNEERETLDCVLTSAHLQYMSYIFLPYICTGFCMWVGHGNPTPLQLPTGTINAHPLPEHGPDRHPLRASNNIHVFACTQLPAIYEVDHLHLHVCVSSHSLPHCSIF